MENFSPTQGLLLKFTTGPLHDGSSKKE